MSWSRDRAVDDANTTVSPRPVPGRLPDAGAELPEEEAAASVWAKVRDQLESLRQSIVREIRAYPPPIAGCDQQFNFLLERRDRVTEELGRLAFLRGDGADDLEALSEFIGASVCLDDELKARLIADLDRSAAKESSESAL